MIQWVSMLFIPIGWFLVSWFGIFNDVNSWAAVTILGAVISVFLAVMLFFIKIRGFEIKVIHVERVENLLFLGSLIIFLYLFYVLQIYGYSPALSFFIDGYASPDMLDGKYRSQMPLLSLIPPLAVAQAVVAFNILQWRWTIKSVFVKLVVLIALILLSMVADTRHVFLWPVLYFICGKVSIGELFRSFKKTHLVCVLVVLQLFVFLGNIRIGQNDAVDFTTRQFAINYDLNPIYWDAPAFVVWGTIYLFGGFARGLVCQDEIEAVHFTLAENMFPGVLQFIPKALGLQILPATDRLAYTTMTVGGYHGLCLQFGLMGGVLFFAGQVLFLIFLANKIKQTWRSVGYVESGLFVLFLWLGVRVLLLPIGPNILIFSGWIEGLFLYFFLKYAGIQVFEKGGKRDV